MSATAAHRLYADRDAPEGVTAQVTSALRAPFGVSPATAARATV